MKTKQMTIPRLMISLITAMILCLGVAMPAFASEGPISTGDEDKSAEAAITKMLKIAEGTKIPDSTFTFMFTPKEVAGLSVPAGVMPKLAEVSISYTDADSGKAKDAVNGLVYVPKEVKLFGNVVWPHAGVYVYTIREKESSDTQITYSTAQYDIYVYVANKAGGGLYISAVSARIIENDESNAGAETNAKVDPMPGDGEDVDHSKLIFTNTYVKKPDEKPPTVVENQKLNIGMNVAGAYGNKTKYFDFVVDLQKPATLGNETTYRAYVVEMAESGLKVVTSEENYIAFKASDVFGNYIEIKTGIPLTVKLRDGQQLVFTGMHDGVSYIVTEKGAADYTASVTISEHGSNQDVILSNEYANEDRSTAPDDDQTLRRIVNETGNKAAFTNQYKYISPLGIGVDTFPYVIIITVAITILVAFAAVRYSRRSESDE